MGTKTTAGDLQAIYEDLSASMSDLSEKLQEAKNNAEYAMRYAESAQEEAQQAYEYADSCDDRIMEALNELKDLDEVRQRISDFIETLSAEEGSNDPQDSLSYQIQKHGRRVMRMAEQGASDQAIAKQLSISETLVDLIKRHRRSVAA